MPPSNHPGDDELQGLVDGECLGRHGRNAREAAAWAHLALCPACAEYVGRLQARDREIEGLLSALDDSDELVPSGPHAPEAIADRIITLAAVTPHRRRRAVLAASVAMLVAAGAAAAAAVPGSPIRALLVRVGARHDQAAVHPVAAGRNASQGTVDSGSGSGIAFMPGRGAVVVFRSRQATGVLRITLSASPELRVTPSGPVSGYSLRGDTLMIDNTGSGASYDLVLPQRAARAAVRVAQRTVFLASAGRIAHPRAVDGTGAVVMLFRSLTSPRLLDSRDSLASFDTLSRRIP